MAKDYEKGNDDSDGGRIRHRCKRTVQRRHFVQIYRQLRELDEYASQPVWTDDRNVIVLYGRLWQYNYDAQEPVRTDNRYFDDLY